MLCFMNDVDLELFGMCAVYVYRKELLVISIFTGLKKFIHFDVLLDLSLWIIMSDCDHYS